MLEVKQLIQTNMFFTASNDEDAENKGNKRILLVTDNKETN